MYTQEYGNKTATNSRMECRKDVMEYIASGVRNVVRSSEILPSIIPNGHDH